MNIPNQEPPNIKKEKCCLLCCPQPWWKIIVCVILGLLVVVGGVCVGIQVGKKQASSLEICKQDLDCVLAIDEKDCCRCPKAVNKKDLEKNKNLIKYPLEQWQEWPMVDLPECRDVVCKPCASNPWAVCLDELCTVATSRDQTETWKTYTHEECGFQIKYPADFAEYQEAGDIYIERYISDERNISIRIDLVYPEDEEIKEILSLKEGDKINIGAPVGSKDRYIERIQNRKIDDQFVSQYKGNFCLIDSPCLADSVTWYVYFKGKSNYCRIFMDDRALEENRGIFNLILSTFKFLD